MAWGFNYLKNEVLLSVGIKGLIGNYLASKKFHIKATNLVLDLLVECLQNAIFSCCNPSFVSVPGLLLIRKAEETGAEYDAKDIN